MIIGVIIFDVFVLLVVEVVVVVVIVDLWVMGFK